VILSQTKPGETQYTTSINNYVTNSPIFYYYSVNLHLELFVQQFNLM